MSMELQDKVVRESKKYDNSQVVIYLLFVINIDWKDGKRIFIL